MAVNLISSEDISIQQTGSDITLNVEKDNEVSTSSTKPIENQAITNYVNSKTQIEQVNPSDYITVNSSFTFASGSPTAYKVGNLVFYTYDIISGTFNNGQTIIGSASNKLKTISWGSGRIATSSGTPATPVSIIAIPSGDVRIYTNMANGAKSAGTIILLVKD